MSKTLPGLLTHETVGDGALHGSRGRPTWDGEGMRQGQTVKKQHTYQRQGAGIRTSRLSDGETAATPEARLIDCVQSSREARLLQTAEQGLAYLGRSNLCRGAVFRL